MSLFPYLGGKRLLAKEIVKIMPEHTCYVEAFAGAANVLFRKPVSKAEVLNDINNDIVTLYRVVQHHKDELLRQFDYCFTSRAEFDRLNMTPPATLTDIQKAARFLYLQKISFGGKVVGRHYGTETTRIRMNFHTLDKVLELGAERLKKRKCGKFTLWRRY